MSEDLAVKVENVSKEFYLPHEKAGSVKNVFTSLLRQIRKRRTYETQHALQDVSFEIKKGEFFGVVGRNGSGKSTLLKIMAGIYQPTSGKIMVAGKLVPFIELGVGFNPELTGRENIFLNGALMGFSQKEVEAMYDEIVEFAELERFMDQKLKNYSSGMQVRLAFSLAIRAETDILLIDEVLAVGDADFQKKCFNYFKSLKQQEKTVIFVSHDMNAVQEYCDNAILIEKSKVIVRGTSREVAAAYTRMFLEQNDSGGLKNKKKRWGNQAVKYEQVSATPKKLGDNAQLTVSTVAKAHADLKEVVLGFSIRGSDDNSIVGTNNKLVNKRLTGVKKGEQIKIEWQVPNIFNTGNYVVDVAIQNEDYSEVYDWWEGAASFMVQRSADNSYPIHPIIDAKIEKKH